MADIQNQRLELARRPVGQAYWLLRAGFTAAPVLAGLDKFSERLVEWEKYLSPTFSRALPVSPRTFMKAVGVIEVAAGVLVATRPAIGSYVVAGWLGGIIANLATHPRRYGDIALRDLGLALGALALARLEAERTAHQRQESRTPQRIAETQRQYAPSQPTTPGSGAWVTH